MAAPMLIRAVTELLADVPADGRSLLDVSCRKGDVLAAVAGRGFELRGTNFADRAELAPAVPIDDGVDLLKGLPYPDRSFDVVLLIEVIEHVENHRAAIAEVARVLKPGGTLVLTTPNIMRLSSRFHFLLTGYHKTKRRFVPAATPLAEAFRYHVYPIDLPVLAYLFGQCGLEIERFGKSRVKAFNWILFPLLAPFAALYSAYFLIARQKDPVQRRADRTLLGWLLHPRTLLEDNLVIRARKRT